MRVARVATAGTSEWALVDEGSQTWRRTGVAGDDEWPMSRLAGLPASELSPAEPVDRERLLAPVAPRIIVGVGLNYRAHAAEQGRALPDEPRLFLKNLRSIAPPFGNLPVHPASAQLDYEAELGIVIGRDVFDASPAEAEAAIAGWVIVQDYTLRDLVRPETLALAKGGPAMAPLGPWFTSVDAVSIERAGDLRLRCTVNGVLRQDASTADMHFSPVELVHHIARFLPLGPGDVIATGSPGGSGVGLKPPRWLAPGDVIETEITGLGSLRQQVTGPA
ncbi:MAG: fumarylacetoacetate hydrolase family protein [Erythrobacter sp.]|nr:fumarylacetoacetate hydrolase family protein [Erythrobacter sp.]